MENSKLVRWAYVKEKFGKCRAKLKTHLQYEIVSKTDRSCVPYLAAMEVNVKLQEKKATKDVSVPVDTVYKEELSDILAKGYGMVTEYQNAITLRLDSATNDEDFWLLSQIRKTVRKLTYFIYQL